MRSINLSSRKLPTSVNSLLTSPNESNITTHVYYTYVIAILHGITVPASARVSSKFTSLRRFRFISHEAIYGLSHEISNGCLPCLAALMDAKSGILGRQFRGTFRGVTERSDETTLEGKLINRWNIHADGLRVRGSPKIGLSNEEASVWRSSCWKYTVTCYIHVTYIRHKF